MYNRIEPDFVIAYLGLISTGVSRISLMCVRRTLIMAGLLIIYWPLGRLASFAPRQLSEVATSHRRQNPATARRPIS